MRGLLSLVLQLRAEAAVPGEAVGGAPEVRHQGRERARDRASGEVSCAVVIISASPLLLAEAIRLYLVDCRRLSLFFFGSNGTKVLVLVSSVIALMCPGKMSSGSYPISVVTC
jgi:hypothetical protein